MPNDTTVQVAVVGVFTTLITTIGVIVVAFINNRKERGGAANEGVEAALRERVAFNESQIAILQRSNDRKEEVIQRLRAENDALEEENERLRKQQ